LNWWCPRKNPRLCVPMRWAHRHDGWHCPGWHLWSLCFFCCCHKAAITYDYSMDIATDHPVAQVLGTNPLFLATITNLGPCEPLIGVLMTCEMMKYI
jgi:hypothetical protein